MFASYKHCISMSFVQTDYTKKYSILDSEVEKGNRGDSASTMYHVFLAYCIISPIELFILLLHSSSLHLIPAYIRDEHMARLLVHQI